MIQPMKAITLWQPWASLLACGAKVYETRSWETRYRGPIAIHAAEKKHDYFMFGEEFAIKAMGALELKGINPQELPHGCIIAVAELVDCEKIKKYYDEGSWITQSFTVNEMGSIRYKAKVEVIRGDELLFGYWEPGRYAWKFANMRMLDKPIPCKGKQRIWNWDGVG